MIKAFSAAGADTFTKHSYHEVYSDVFINPIKSVLVIGSPSTAKGIRNLYPDVKILLVQHSPKHGEYILNNIPSVKIDLRNPLRTLAGLYFDLIIDDYTHSISDYIPLYDTLRRNLLKGGKYIIEDIRTPEDLNELEHRGFTCFDYVSKSRRWDDRIAVWTQTEDISDKVRPITCITPTGDREESFYELVTCMNNQNVKPDNWIIVDDGITPIAEDVKESIKVPFTYIRETPVEYHSLSRNMRTALSTIENGDIIMIEDDEWYGPDYIAKRHRDLDITYLAGDLYRHRYSLSNGGTYGVSKQSGFSCLHSTAFRSEILTDVMAAIGTSNKHNVDVRIWDMAKTDKYIPYMIYRNEKPYMVTIKAWPNGRAGTMGLHRRPLGSKDADHSQLFKWLGDDYDRYVKYIHDANDVYTFSRDMYGFWKQDNPDNIEYTIEYKQQQRTDECMSWLRLGYLFNTLNIPVSEYSKWTVCDVGSGNGKFAEQARRVFGTVYEYDVSGDTISEDQLYNTDWDCIFLTDVLEHFSNIDDLFRIKFKYIFLSFPECPYAEDYKDLKTWRHYKPNEHIYMLNADNVKEWLDVHGYKAKAIGNPEDAIRKSPYPINISTIVAEKL